MRGRASLTALSYRRPLNTGQGVGQVDVHRRVPVKNVLSLRLVLSKNWSV